MTNLFLEGEALLFLRIPSLHLQMIRIKIQVFEGPCLFIIPFGRSKVDSCQTSRFRTVVSKNIISESDISAVNSDCIVVQRTTTQFFNFFVHYK